MHGEVAKIGEVEQCTGKTPEIRGSDFDRETGPAVCRSKKTCTLVQGRTGASPCTFFDTPSSSFAYSYLLILSYALAAGLGQSLLLLGAGVKSSSLLNPSGRLS